MGGITLLQGLMLQWVIVHICMAAAHLILFYTLADIATYGGRGGVLALTPLRYFFDEQGPASLGFGIDGMRLMINFVFDVSDTLAGLLSFDYGYLRLIDEGDGFVYVVMTLLEIATWHSSIAAIGALIAFIISTGVMSSNHRGRRGAGSRGAGYGRRGIGILGREDEALTTLRLNHRRRDPGPAAGSGPGPGFRRCGAGRCPR